MNQFEHNLVQSFNSYFFINNIPADVRRFPQLRWIVQPCDIIIDSPVVGHIAFECKSTNAKRLFFGGHFHIRKDGTHQVEALDDYFYRSGRTAYLAVELKKKGARNRCCLLPWQFVISAYRAGYKSLTASEIINNSCVVYRHGGFYQLDDFFE